MHLLFIGHNYKPEVNASATRLSEHASLWGKDEHTITVLTAAPHFPEGKVYEGFLNRYKRSVDEGVDLIRVPSVIAANEGFVKRILSYLSFMVSAIWYSRKVRKPDLVVATSPQFFSAVAGYVVSRLKRVPFVLEIRDIWPESIVAVGAMGRSPIIRFFEWLERFLYRKALLIITLGDGYKSNIVSKGIDPDKIRLFPNAVDPSFFASDLDQTRLAAIRREYDLDGKFVVSYIGTTGMAHRADVLLEAATRCTDPTVVFMVVGTGAQAAEIEEQAERLPNVRYVAKQPRNRIRYFYELSDVGIVHLRNTPIFRTVLPSKIFEWMAVGRPILIGVEGSSRNLVEEARAGLYFEPENPADLLTQVVRLKTNTPERQTFAEHGRAYVSEHHDRTKIAAAYLEELAKLVDVAKK